MNDPLLNAIIALAVATAHETNPPAHLFAPSVDSPESEIEEALRSPRRGGPGISRMVEAL